MKLGLNCTPDIRGILQELLLTRGIDLDANFKDSPVCLVEAGCEIPGDKVVILFELKNLGQLIGLLDQLAKVSDENPNTIVGKSIDDSYQIIAYSHVYYFEARGNNVFCITAGAVQNSSNEYRIKEKLYELEGRLPQNQFIRVGKSHIVNIQNVAEIIPWFGRRLILRFIDGRKEIEVSRNYAKNLKTFLGI